jgi:transcriptional regulator with XRE-family HTH domain
VKHSEEVTKFGAAVKNRRNHLDLSQEELAWRSQLHRTYISDVERGVRNISLQTIVKLAVALQTSIPDLFRPAGSESDSATRAVKTTRKAGKP